MIENCVGSVYGFNGAVYDEMYVGYRAEPDFVITFALTLEGATIHAQQVFEFGV